LSHASSPQILLIIKYYLVKFRDWYWVNGWAGTVLSCDFYGEKNERE
jgi:hypothetical protein